MESELRVMAARIWAELGPGFSERVYHNAFEVELRLAGIPYETERIITVPYRDHIVGNLRADLIVYGSIIVELKSTTKLKDEFANQAKNYMRLTGIPNALLINFPAVSGEVEVRFFSAQCKDDAHEGVVPSGGAISSQTGEAM
jgi:GxxExxY protein